MAAAYHALPPLPILNRANCTLEMQAWFGDPEIENGAKSAVHTVNFNFKTGSD
ncbi:hypothetical protein GOZ83_25265 [Agrobacterium vitis]|nr:hypothetical protein [Agrobacterium vitis]